MHYVQPKMGNFMMALSDMQKNSADNCKMVVRNTSRSRPNSRQSSPSVNTRQQNLISLLLYAPPTTINKFYLCGECKVQREEKKIEVVQAFMHKSTSSIRLIVCRRTDVETLFSTAHAHLSITEIVVYFQEYNVKGKH